MSRLFVPGGQSTSIEWWNRLLKTQLSCHLGENTLRSWSNLLWACNIYVGWSANMGFPGGSVIKNPPASVGDTGSIPGSGRSLRKGNGNALQNSFLGNPMDRGAWQATVPGVTESQTRLGDQTTTISQYTMLCSHWLEHMGLGRRHGLSSVPETFSGKVLHSHRQNFPSLEALIFRDPKVSFELELHPPPAHFGLLTLVDQQAKKEGLWWFCTM